MAMMSAGTEEAELTSFEKECVKKVEEQVDLEEEMALGKDDASHRLWQSFQDSATAAGKFYLAFTDQTRAVPESLCGALFHEAACNITKLYSEAGDVCSKGIDLGIEYGNQKRTKELLNWLKKKKKYIRRDELMAFLAGEHCPSSGHSGVGHQPSSMLPGGQMEESSGRSLYRHSSGGSYHDNQYAPSLSQAMNTLQCSVPRMVSNIPTPSGRRRGLPRRNTALKLGDANQFFKDICTDQTRKRVHNSYPQEMISDYPLAKREKQPVDGLPPPP